MLRMFSKKSVKKSDNDSGIELTEKGMINCSLADVKFELSTIELPKIDCALPDLKIKPREFCFASSLEKSYIYQKHWDRFTLVPRRSISLIDSNFYYESKAEYFRRAKERHDLAKMMLYVFDHTPLAEDIILTVIQYLSTESSNYIKNYQDLLSEYTSSGQSREWHSLDLSFKVYM